jgi:hypothetical protein
MVSIKAQLALDVKNLHIVVILSFRSFEYKPIEIIFLYN